MPFRHLEQEDLDFLKTLLDAEQMSTGASNLKLHSADQAHHKGYLPEVVIWPKTTGEVYTE